MAYRSIVGCFYIRRRSISGLKPSPIFGLDDKEDFIFPNRALSARHTYGVAAPADRA
jgi:hypothetical protein